MTPKQFLKRALVGSALGMIVVVAASLSYAYVVPSLLDADSILYATTDEISEKSIETFQNTTEKIEKIHNSNLSSSPLEAYAKYRESTSSAGIVDYSAVSSGKVTRIIDGDTIDIDGIRIRLALVNTPERDQYGYEEALAFTRSSCPVGSTAVYDIDDGQKDSYGRMIAKVWCLPAGKSLNSMLIEHEHAEILSRFCSVSEFGDDDWAASRC